MNIYLYEMVAVNQEMGTLLRMAMGRHLFKSLALIFFQ